MNVRALLMAGASALAIALGVLLLMRAVASTPPLGPIDGGELPPTDLERVSAGDAAPDFSLRALSGDVHRLSDYRGDQNVVLVFYRGHW